MKKTVEDVMPIATGHEREEIEAALQVIFILIFLLRVRKFSFKQLAWLLGN